MKGRHSWTRALAVYGILLVLIAGVVVARSLIIQRLASEGGQTPNIYSRHYALITGRGDEEFWTQVYESAREVAAEADGYVEWFGKDLAADYSVNDLARMAMNASVDGIILQATDEEGTEELIGEIVAAGIPVITALTDCPESVRQSYVGVNNYDIGQLYGQKMIQHILTHFRKNIRILVAVNGDRISSSQNLILLGMRESLKKGLPSGYFVNIETELIDQGSSYAAEEYFNTLFVSEKNLPEILVCLDERETRCAYLSAVDHNRVGETVMIGYYYSEDILSAVEKQVLDCTLAVDASEIGRGAVDALLDCEEYGLTNSYQAVNVELLGQKEAEKLLQESREADIAEEGKE